MLTGPRLSEQRVQSELLHVLPAWPLTRLSFCWHPLYIHLEAPTKGREGVQQNDISFANG